MMHRVLLSLCHPAAITLARQPRRDARLHTSPCKPSRRIRSTIAVSSAHTTVQSSRAEFKAEVQAGRRPLFGLFLNSASPLVAEQLSMLDYDYMLVDIQHAPTDYQNLAAMLTAVNAAGKPALVRVEGPHDRGGIQQALDLGAAGIMVPTIQTAADVEKVVLAAFYPSPKFPTGSRSISWPIRPQRGRPVAEYINAANDEVVLIVQVETKKCYDELEAVLSVPGIDCCFVGPVDLSHALGLAQRLGFPTCFDSPEFQGSLQRVLRVCKDNGVAAGNFAVSEEKAQEMLSQGFTLLATGTDVGLLGEAAAKNAAFAAKLRATAPGPIKGS